VPVVAFIQPALLNYYFLQLAAAAAAAAGNKVFLHTIFNPKLSIYLNEISSKMITALVYHGVLLALLYVPVPVLEYYPGIPEI
jgi:hypothetical protein